MVLKGIGNFGAAAPATTAIEPIGAGDRFEGALDGNRTVIEHAVERVRAAGASPTLAFQMAMDALDLLGLKDSAGTRFESLSEGERDRVIVAQTMIAENPLSADEIPQARAALQRLVSLGT